MLASIYFRDNEVIVGSSASQLASSFPENVINHPLHYLDGRSCSPDCNASVVWCSESCVCRKQQSRTAIRCSTFPSPRKRSVSLWSACSWSASRRSTPCLRCRCTRSRPSQWCRFPAISPRRGSRSCSPACIARVHVSLRCSPELPSPSLLPAHLSALLPLEESARPADGLRLVLDVPANSAILSLVRVSDGLYATLWSQRLACAVGAAVDARFLAYATRGRLGRR